MKVCIACSRTARASPSRSRAPISGGRSLFEDREGNIWVGTIEGLARLSERRLPRLSNLGSVSSIEATPDGTLWIAAVDGLFTFSRTASVWTDRPKAWSTRAVHATHVARDGTLWVADTAGLWKRTHGALVRVTTPASIVPERITAMSTSADSRTLWIASSHGGLVKWNPDAGDASVQPATALTSERVSTVFADGRGRVWVASEAGRLGVLRDLIYRMARIAGGSRRRHVLCFPREQ